jgi:hypothetical protein
VNSSSSPLPASLALAQEVLVQAWSHPLIRELVEHHSQSADQVLAATGQGLQELGVGVEHASVIHEGRSPTPRGMTHPGIMVPALHNRTFESQCLIGEVWWMGLQTHRLNPGQAIQQQWWMASCVESAVLFCEDVIRRSHPSLILSAPRIAPQVTRSAPCPELVEALRQVAGQVWAEKTRQELTGQLDATVPAPCPSKPRV